MTSKNYYDAKTIRLSEQPIYLFLPTELNKNQTNAFFIQIPSL